MADPDLLAGYDDADIMAAVSDIAAHPQHAAQHMANPKARWHLSYTASCSFSWGVHTGQR